MNNTPHDRSETIDWLRGFAVLLVVEYHVSPWPIFVHGNYGVLLFFIVSGYCIAFSANSSTSAWHFYAKRLGRLMPALLVCSFITIAIKWLWPQFVDAGRENSLFDWLYTPIALATLNFPSIGYRPADGAYWSLQVEFQFYILYAAIMLFGIRQYAVQCFCVFVLIIGLSASPGIPGSYDFFPYFLAGMSVAAVVSGDQRAGYIGLISAFLADLIFLVRGFQQPSMGIGLPRTTMLWLGTAMVWIAAASVPRVQLAKALRPLAFVGLISYPLYLLHQDIMLVIYHSLGIKLYPGMPSPYIVGCIGVFALTPLFISLATIVHYRVERPLIRPLTKILSGGKMSSLRSREIVSEVAPQ